MSARQTDPDTSHHAAAQTVRYETEIIQAIRHTLRNGPLNQFDIAARIEFARPGRWKESTIRTACARAGLRRVGTELVDGRPVALWELEY